MKFVDAHVHLSDEEYSGSIEEIITEAKDSNVVIYETAVRNRICLAW